MKIRDFEFIYQYINLSLELTINCYTKVTNYSSSIKGHAVIHTASLFIATAGILGKHMGLFPPFVTFSRCLVALIILFVILTLRHGKIPSLPYKDKYVLFSGVLMCLHWVTFFYSIEYSSVAIAAISVFTFPIFTALLEPLIKRIKIDQTHLIIGFFLMVGIVVMSPTLSFENQTFLGILFGLCSALAYAIRNIFSQTLGQKYGSVHLMLYQVIIVAILLSPFAMHHEVTVIKKNALSLVALGILPTIIGHGLLVESFKFFSVSKASILTSFQVLFAIVLAMIFLGEYPASNVWIGGAIITLAVLYEITRKVKN